LKELQRFLIADAVIRNWGSCINWDLEAWSNGVVLRGPLLAASAACFQTKAMHDNTLKVAVEGHTGRKAVLRLTHGQEGDPSSRGQRIVTALSARFSRSAEAPAESGDHRRPRTLTTGTVQARTPYTSPRGTLSFCAWRNGSAAFVGRSGLVRGCVRLEGNFYGRRWSVLRGGRASALPENRDALNVAPNAIKNDRVRANTNFGERRPRAFHFAQSVC
jgi:hypothetical protein